MRITKSLRRASRLSFQKSAILAAVWVACSGVRLWAFEDDWDGGATTNMSTGENISWSDSSNWDFTLDPSGGDAVDLPPSSTPPPTYAYNILQGLGQNYSIQYMKIETTTLYSIEANSTSSSTPRTLTFTGSAGKPLIELFNDPVTGIFNFGEQPSTYGELTIALDQSGLGAFSVDSSAAFLVVGGPVTGSGGISKQGPGTLEMVADTSDGNTFSGGFELDGGTVEIGKGTNGTLSGLLGTGTITVTDGTSVLATVDSYAYTLANAVTVNSTLNLGNTSTGSITLSGAISLGSSTRTVNVTDTATFSGVVSGSGGLDATGSGTLVLAGASTYSDGTTLAAGTLTLGGSSSGSLGSLSNGPVGTGTLTVNGGTLATGNGAQTIGNAVSVGGDFTITGSLTLTGSISVPSSTHTATIGNGTAASSLTIGGTTSTSGSTLSLTVEPSSSLTFSASTGGSIRPQRLNGLTVHSNGTAVVANPSTHAERTVLTVSSLYTGTTAATLDLSGNDMIVTGTSLSTVAGYLATGYNSGGWNGSKGIISSAGASTAYTGLGVEVNNIGSGTILMTSFDGQTVTSSDVLVKYTYMGDADLNGVINGTDFTLIDNALIAN